MFATGKDCVWKPIWADRGPIAIWPGNPDFAIAGLNADATTQYSTTLVTGQYPPYWQVEARVVGVNLPLDSVATLRPQQVQINNIPGYANGVFVAAKARFCDVNGAALSQWSSEIQQQAVF